LTAGSLVATPALAGDVVISGSSTGPLASSNADGAGSGNITITSSGTVATTTDAATSIVLDSDNTVLNAGKITASGASAFGISSSSALGGTITNEGTITAAGKDGTGIYAGAGVYGGIINRGSIVTGTLGTLNTQGVATDGVAGGHALWIASDSGPVVLSKGSALTTYGGAEAFYIGQGGTSGYRTINLGALTGDTGLSTSVLIEGNVTSRSAVTGALVRAFSLYGTTVDSVDYTTTLSGAIHNTATGNITAYAVDGTANAIYIGALSTVPSFVNAGVIYGRTVDSGENATTGEAGSGGGDAYGIIIQSGASLTSFVNTGSLIAESRGASQSAYALIDNSGTLTSITNQGTWTASVNGTGTTVAMDLSSATKAITLTNSGTIAGNIKFGSGNDTITSTAGAVTGDITLGSGDDTLSFSNTSFTGGIDAGVGTNTISLVNSSMKGGAVHGGATSLTLSNSQLTIPSTSYVQVSDVHVSANSSVTLQVNSLIDGGGVLKAAGVVEFASGSSLTAQFIGAVTDEQTINLIEAGTLTLNSGVSILQPTSNSIMYEQKIKLSDDNINILQLNVRRRTADELGLNATQGAVYDAAVPAMANDEEIMSQFVGFTTRDELAEAVDELSPHINDAVRATALTTQYLAQGAIRRRLNGLPRREDSLIGREYASYWAQVYGTSAERTSSNVADAFKLTSGGIAAGFDSRWTRNSRIGVSLSETYSRGEMKSETQAPLDSNTTALNIYVRDSNKYTFTDVIAGVGLSNYNGGRTVTVGDITREALSSWSGYQLATSVDTGVQFASNTTRVKAFVRGAYLQIREEDYVETGAGSGINLAFEPRDTRSIRAGGGVSLEQLFSLSDEATISLEARGDYAREFETNPANIRVRFASSVDDETVSAFIVKGVAASPNVFTGGAGMTFRQRGSAFSLDYDMERSDGFVAHTLSATYRLRF
jgi:uncharacterized protein with beta-barrel porin domain